MAATEPRNYPFTEADRLTVDPAFAGLRKDEPLCRVRFPYGEAAWLVTRYEDVRTVLGDPRFSRAEAVHRDEPRLRPHRGLEGSILDLDPPDHTRLRRIVAKAFTARHIERLRPRTEQIAAELADGMAARGAPADLVADFALPLPVTVICELLGVPLADRADFRTWSDALLSTTRYTPREIQDCTDALMAYMAGLIAERRTTPHEDLLGALVDARDNDERLSERELQVLAVSLLVAGHETTASQIPNFVYTLLTHPGQLAALRADPGLVPGAVEELMRYVPLGNGAGMPRYALDDVELSGGTVRAGEAVVVCPVSANRDEAVYTDPDRLDVLRQEASHVGFGHGPHHCLGAQLARMELQVALSTLLDRLPGLRLAGPEESVVWKSGVALRGPERMPVTWDGSRDA
ncbi:cytochrome P450 [Actinacidiphila glaucinigra]|uniref:cytochrome P450 n=1 Tax=Actinacidiphila glaucinigra TaxID=235986 RepID=UPI002E3461BA|nr:cytochrome P450 [Actinacidiphila glaucinigra]